ncbi:hypothetical protein ACH95_05380 [Bacillus glycinifermentans]|nr:hypothetical protein ACH95_05380 [Bacillus glycinifermentans]
MSDKHTITVVTLWFKYTGTSTGLASLAGKEDTSLANVPELIDKAKPEIKSDETIDFLNIMAKHSFNFFWYTITIHHK